MFILELSRAFPSANEPLLGIFEWDQSSALSKEKQKIVFVAINCYSIRHKRKYGCIFKTRDNIPVFDCNFPLGRVPKPIIIFVSWIMFKVAYRKILHKYGKPDLIHAHSGSVCGVVACKAKRKFHIPFCVTEHDSKVLLNSLTKYEHRWLQRVYDSANLRIAVSPSFKKYLGQSFLLEFTYIPNVVDTSLFFLRKIQENRPFSFVSVGNLVAGKGMDILINAFGRLHTKNPYTTLAIVGEGPEHDALSSQIEKLGVQDSVFLLGLKSRSEISSIFCEADCFVLASHYETFGVVYIEAMASGLPVIATKCGGPEGVIPNFAGRFVDVNDELQLSDAMEYMVNNAKLFSSSKIREYCIRNFSQKAVAKRLIEAMVKI